ncbi:MAG: 4-hydroxybenzoate octaprenyltransferase [Pseudomonadota bacterium]
MLYLLTDSAKRRAVGRLTRLDKPVGIYLLLWPTLWALFIAAEGIPPVSVLLIFVVGTVLMRMAGCAINDYADRNVDGEVARTRDRPLATGELVGQEAVVVFVVLSLLAFGLVLLTNRLTVLLSFAGVALAAIYPFMKRYTHFPQLFLGAAFAWAIPMAFAAVTQQLPPIAWLLFVATVLLTVAYDTQYAMVDREDDLRAGIRSIAIALGDIDRVAIGLLQTLMLLALLFVGQREEFGAYYLLGLAAAAALFAYQQVLIRDREPAACFRAFRNNQWVGLVIFLGIAAETVRGPAA